MKDQLLDTAELTKMIDSLEKKSEMQKHDIEHSLTDLAENLKPVNLIKNGFRRLFGKGEKLRGQIAAQVFKKNRSLPSPRVIKINAR
jgi:hypothetical protein